MRIFRIIIITVCAFFITWFTLYFSFLNFINVEFSNYDYSKLFPKQLAFAATASIYSLFLIFMKRKNGGSFSNIFKFGSGIILSLVPLFVFGYLNTSNCIYWKINKRDIKTLYESKISNRETIKLIEFKCPENSSKTIKTVQVIELTPLFISTSSIDSTKISGRHWKKL